MKKYDFLIVGAGLFGSVCARELTKRGFKCLVIDRRNHTGGNCHSEIINGTHVSLYGGHYFSTDNRMIWDYVNSHTPFMEYSLSVKSNNNGRIFSYPINLTTMNQLWGVSTPKEAREMLERVRIKIDNPQNYEEKALGLVGEELYHALIYGYTKKHWGMEPREIPLIVANRIPLRTYYEERYYTRRYQGIPMVGWKALFDSLLDGIDVRLNEEFVPSNTYEKLIYTGSIDEYFNYSLGRLDYRYIKYEYSNIDLGVAMMAYPGNNVSYARQFCYTYSTPGFEKINDFITATEYTTDYDEILAYPINTVKNTVLYSKYAEKAEPNVFFGGRLGGYRYENMDKIIEMAFELVNTL